ncbi:MAG TPA: SPFH domain-containing protein [Actinomycetes bacterium]|nr:SPFH domain-containing protein [Actinomycetes bacterium]
MADISKYPFIRHFRGAPTDHVVHLYRGMVAHSGTGQSFWFRPLSAALSLVPADDRELPLLFHARTSDFQDVTVQSTVTYRFEDPAEVAGRIDFAIDPDTGTWRTNPLDQVAHLLTELAQQYALDLLASMTLDAALAGGVTAVRAAVTEGLESDTRLAQTGISVIGVRVVAIRPEPELERALQTPTREQVQQKADKATYERRALAVERERAISENELQSQIELATRTEQLVTQQGANERRRVTEAAAAERIAVEAKAVADRLRAAARAETVRVVGAAEAETDTAKMAVYAEVDPKVLLALALRDLGRQLRTIGTLNLSPDLLSTALAQLTAPKAAGNGAGTDGS